MKTIPANQPDLFAARDTHKPRAVAPGDVRIERLIELLRGQGWVKREHLARALGVPDRTMRKIKEASEGLVISNSEQGYKLITEATLEEIAHARAEWCKRKEAAERAIANIDRIRHRMQLPERKAA